MKLSETLSAPSWVVLQLVEACNLRCTMCYEWGEAGAYHERPETATLELEVALRIVRECLPRRPYFELFGGEPLLHPGIWDVLRAIREGGCEVAFPTNGTLLEANAARLVDAQPTRVWVSLDGPEQVNDAQRGHGVFRRVMRGIDALEEARARRDNKSPELGITCVVTPANHAHVAELFFEAIDVYRFDAVSIELQSYATEQQYRKYARVARELGAPSTAGARAYVRDPAVFAGIDRVALSQQMTRVRDACVERGIRFFSQPRVIDPENLDRYLRGAWEELAERRSRCAFPWTYAEVSARGEVTTCHTFYDLSIGNVHEQPLLDIWRGQRAGVLRQHLRKELLPICTACCRYYA